MECHGNSNIQSILHLVASITSEKQRLQECLAAVDEMLELSVDIPAELCARLKQPYLSIVNEICRLTERLDCAGLVSSCRSLSAQIRASVHRRAGFAPALVPARPGPPLQLAASGAPMALLQRALPLAPGVVAACTSLPVVMPTVSASVQQAALVSDRLVLQPPPFSSISVPLALPVGHSVVDLNESFATALSDDAGGDGTAVGIDGAGNACTSAVRRLVLSPVDARPAVIHTGQPASHMAAQFRQSAVSLGNSAVNLANVVGRSSVVPSYQQAPADHHNRKPASIDRRSDSESTHSASVPSTRVRRAVGARVDPSSLVARHLAKKSSSASALEIPLQEPLKSSETHEMRWVYRDPSTGYSFFVKTADHDILEQMTSELGELAKSPVARPPSTVNYNDNVMAEFDQAWYRARVVDIKNWDRDTPTSLMLLVFLDYGNVIGKCLSAIRVLPERYRRLPPLAYKCIVVGLEPGRGDRFELQGRIMSVLTAADSTLLVKATPTDLPALYMTTVSCQLREPGSGSCQLTVDMGQVIGAVNSLSPSEVTEALQSLPSLELLARLNENHAALIDGTAVDVNAGGATSTDSVHQQQLPYMEKVSSWLTQMNGEGGAVAPDELAGLVTPLKHSPTPLLCMDGERARRRHPSVISESTTTNPFRGDLVMGFETRRRAGAGCLHQPDCYSRLRLVWDARPIHLAMSAADHAPDRIVPLHVESPDDFYIPRGDSDMFDMFERRLAEAYARLPVHPLQHATRMLQQGTYWVARWNKTDGWYRCTVLRSCQANVNDETAQVPVKWMDYGDEGLVHPRDFRPMTSEFASVAVFSVRASLAYLRPRNEQGNPVAEYSERAKHQFRKLVQEKICTLLLVPTNRKDRVSVVLEVVAESGNISVIDSLVGLGEALMVLPDDEDDTVVIDDAVDAARSGPTSYSPLPPHWKHSRRSGKNKKPSTPSVVHHSVESAVANSNETDNVSMAQWDPMRDEYDDVGVSGEGDESGALRSMLGPGLSDEVCRYYATGRRCWDGDACRHLHVRAADHVASVEVVRSNPDQVTLPTAGSVVYVQVSHVNTPAEFHVQLPFGTIPASTVQRDVEKHRALLCAEETLDSLSAAMTRHYDGRAAAACSGRHQRQRPHYTVYNLPANGEVLVARWQSSWVRAVVEHLVNDSPDEDPRHCHAQLILLDFGTTITCPLVDLRVIEKHHNLLPYQAILCTLAAAPNGVEDSCSWSAAAVERFRQLVARRQFHLAQVLGWRADGSLTVELFSDGNPEDGGDGGGDGVGGGGGGGVTECMVNEELVRQLPWGTDHAVGSKVPG